jgi:hypothetical protein
LALFSCIFCTVTFGSLYLDLLYPNLLALCCCIFCTGTFWLSISGSSVPKSVGSLHLHFCTGNFWLSAPVFSVCVSSVVFSVMAPSGSLYLYRLYLYLLVLCT